MTQEVKGEIDQKALLKFVYTEIAKLKKETPFYESTLEIKKCVSSEYRIDLSPRDVANIIQQCIVTDLKDKLLQYTYSDSVWSKFKFWKKQYAEHLVNPNNLGSENKTLEEYFSDRICEEFVTLKKQSDLLKDEKQNLDKSKGHFLSDEMRLCYLFEGNFTVDPKIFIPYDFGFIDQSFVSEKNPLFNQLYLPVLNSGIANKYGRRNFMMDCIPDIAMKRVGKTLHSQNKISYPLYELLFTRPDLNQNHKQIWQNLEDKMRKKNPWSNPPLSAEEKIAAKAKRADQRAGIVVLAFFGLLVFGLLGKCSDAIKSSANYNDATDKYMSACKGQGTSRSGCEDQWDKIQDYNP